MRKLFKAALLRWVTQPGKFIEFSRQEQEAPEVCCSCFLLLPLSRGSPPRIPTLGELLDHLLIERGYIGRLPTGY
jgi:hypothetical protein